MRLKKGFTLAEILIVLMVIGVIAMMTIPSMMKGVTESQLKAGFKKAYNTIANFAAMERVSGAWPSRGNDDNLALLYQAMNSSLSIKTFAKQSVNAGSVLQSSTENYKNCVTATINGTTTTIGEGDDCFSLHSLSQAASGTTGQDDAIWMVTEDNIAYTVAAGGAGANVNCGSKQTISAQADDENAVSKSCFVLIADVNGLSKGPNSYDPQGLASSDSLDQAAADNATLEPENSMATLTGDQYKIYLGIDGATAGPRMTTTSGRIAADLK